MGEDIEKETYKVQKFNGNKDDFSLWVIRVTTCLKEKGVFNLVKTKEPLVTDERKKDKCLAILINSLGDRPLRAVQTVADDPKEVWDKLHARYASSGASRRVALQTEALTKRWDESMDMEDYVTSFENLYERLEKMGNKVPEETRLSTLLTSFQLSESKEHNNLIEAIKTVDEERFTWEVATSRLIEECNLKNTRGKEKTIEDSNVRLGAAHASRQEQDNGGNGRQRGREIRCYLCDENHMLKDCPCKAKLREFIKEENSKGKSKLGATKTKSLFANAFMANNQVISFAGKDEIVVDSGATEHMSGNKQWLRNLQKIPEQEVELADGRTTTCSEKGSLEIWVKPKGLEKCRLTLSNVLYVSKLETTLLSVKQMDRKGVKTAFGDNKCSLLDDEGVFADGAINDGLRKLNFWANKATQCGVASTTLNLWHRRLGHISKQTIENMSRDKIVDGLTLHDSQSSKNKCDECETSKSTRAPFKGKFEKAEKPGDIIHSDVCGPLPQSFGKKRHLCAFIDEWSRYVYAVPMIAKSEVKNEFHKFRLKFEKQNECTIKCLASDNGGEHVALDGYLEENGIESNRTAPYTPEQNGIAERMNRTLCSMIRSLLQQSGLSWKFWVEALWFSVDARNRCSSRSIEGRTPIEELTGRKPNVKNIRSFGCKVMVHVSKRKKKLEERSIEGMLMRCLRYGNYRIHLPQKKKAIASRNVTFYEDICPMRRDAPQRESLQSNGERSDYEVEVEAAVGEEAASNQQIPDESESETEHQSDASSDESEQASNDCLSSSSDSSSESSHGEEVLDNSRSSSGRSLRNIPRRNYSRLHRGYAATVGVSLYDEPRSCTEATAREDSEKWVKATDEEMNAHSEEKTWAFMNPPGGRKAIDSKLVFKVKTLPDGSIEKCKARLVGKGFQQKAGIDYEETYAPVIDFSIVRLILSIACQQGMFVHQMDVKTAFLNGELQEEIFMRLPDDLPGRHNPGRIVKLLKGLYGLKQAPKVWSSRFRKDMKKIGLKASEIADCVFILAKNGKILILLAHVDDLLLASKHIDLIDSVKKELSNLCKMTDKGEARCFLGVEIRHRNEGTYLMQEGHINGMLAKHGMKDCKPIGTPAIADSGRKEGEEDLNVRQHAQCRQIIGSLQYLTTRTRLDIASAVGVCAKKVSCPNRDDWANAMRMLRCLKGTTNYGLKYARTNSGEVELMAYADADFAGDMKERKSTSGFVLKVNDCSISWRSKKQKEIATGTADAECVAVCYCCKELVWLRRLLKEFGWSQQRPTTVHEDNQACIAWVKEEGTLSKTKHMELKYHYSRRLQRKKVVKLKYCPTDEMQADMLTKPLNKSQFVKIRELVGIVECN